MDLLQALMEKPWTKISDPWDKNEDTPMIASEWALGGMDLSDP